MRSPTALAIACLALLSITTVACGDNSASSDAPHDTAALAVEVGADGIEAPADLPTGTTTFSISAPRDADEPQVQLLELAANTDAERLFDALSNGDLPTALQLADPAGGINLEPGGATELTVELHPARYVFLDPDNGVVSSLLTASGAAGSETAHVDGTVSLRDFEIELPDGFGRGTYAIESTDDSIHGLTLVELQAGVTLDQVRAMLAEDADVPGTELVRAGNLGPGARQVITLQLPAGHYIAASYFPDFDSGSTQAARGMVAEFTVEV
jgi:hypothetical protein